MLEAALATAWSAGRCLAGGRVTPKRSPAVDAHSDSNGRPTLLKALFTLVSTLVLAAIAYAAWIVISTWDRVGV
jgi:hypothetical protein